MSALVAQNVQVTRKGRELADKLNPAIGTTYEILQTCSLICRLATTHHHYMETACNRELSEWEENRIEQIEKRITDLIDWLPGTDEGAFGAFFQGDPRGCTVGLTAPGEWTRLYDGWGQDRINVPQ